MAGLVLAMLVGALVPAAVVSALALRDPLPRDCRSGQATGTTVEGALLYSTGQDLWYSEGYPAKPRKLLDFTPPRPRPAVAAPGGSPGSPSVAPAAPPPPAAAYPARVVAADISLDRKLVAVLVVDPPDRVGSISLLLLSPLEPGAPPVVPWAASPDRRSQRAPTVRVLDNGKVLYSAPVTHAYIPSPSPVPANATTPSPSPAPAVTSPSRGTLLSPSPGVAVLVVAPSSPATVVDQAPEGYFLAQGHSAWADTRTYHVPPALPRLADRVDGNSGRVAGHVDRDAGTPLVHRRLNQVVVGRAGQGHAAAVCSAAAGIVPTGFSPDDGDLVVHDGRDSLLLDLSGQHSATRFLSGRVLAWR